MMVDDDFDAGREGAQGDPLRGFLSDERDSDKVC